VEVQIFGDHHGNVVHLFERDCSVQRRHQKVVEETPSVKLSQELRQAMTEAAVRLASHVGYTNAGTIEFLVDHDDQFYFLEMNTRLQVEHPITEMVTGLDLVELQLLVAAGEKLPISQREIKRHGHALEARIYPEDPATLLPTAGQVTEVTWPQGDHVRVDSALSVGYEVTSHYEPLMAKLAVWGEDRPQALEAMRKALREFRIEGVTTNIPTLSRVLSHATFLEGAYHTGFLEDLMLEPTTEETGNELVAAIAVAMALNEDRSSAGAPSRWKIFARRQAITTRLYAGGP
jgi:acetyl/propionyl-CoA carboxylase alpha subunit